MDDIHDRSGPIKIPERVLGVRDSGLVAMSVLSCVAMLALAAGLRRARGLRARARRGWSRRWVVDPTLVIVGPDGLRVEDDHRRVKMVERSERVSEGYDAPRRIKVLVQEKDGRAWQLQDALEFTHPELGYWAPRIYVLPNRLQDQD